MAVTSNIDNVTAAIKLNAGTQSDGTRITKTVNIAGIKKSAFSNEDKQKLMNIVNALGIMLRYSIFNVVLTTKENVATE